MRNILNSRWARSFFSFGAMHAMRLALPLLAFPWLGRALGEEAFGLLMYMCLFPPVVALVIDWGFPLGAARLAAANRDDAEQLGKLLRGVLLARLFLLAACLGAFALLAPLLPHVTEYPLPFFLALCAGVARGSSPLWFYQGTNSGLRKLAVWDIATSLAVLCLTVLLAREASTWPLYLAFYAICKGLAWLALTLGLLREHPCKWSACSPFRLIKQCRSLFAGLLLAESYPWLSQLIYGFFLEPAALGAILALNKILKAMTSLVQPFTQTIFPEICLLGTTDPQKSRRILQISLAGTVACMCAACAIAWILAPWLLRLALGASFIHNADILRILLLASPLAAANAVLAFQALVPYGHDRAQSAARLFMAIGGLPLAFILTSHADIRGAAFAPLCAEALLFLALCWQVLRLCPQALFSPPASRHLK